MIALYSKDLKKSIMEITAAGNLNPEALTNLNKDLLKKLIALISLSCTIFISSFFINDIYLFFFLIILAFAIIIYSILNLSNLNRFVLPYSCGLKTKAIITGADYERFPFHGYSGWSIRYEFFIRKQKYNGNCVGIKSDDFGEESVKLGNNITVFYIPENPSENAPYLISRYKLFSLKKEP